MAIHFVHIAIQIHEELEKWQTIVFLQSAGVYEVSPSKNFYYLRWVAQLISRWISPRVQMASLAFIVMAATKRLWVCQNKIH